MLVVALFIFEHQDRPVKNTKPHHQEKAEDVGTDYKGDPITTESKVKANQEYPEDGYRNKRGQTTTEQVEGALTDSDMVKTNGKKEQDGGKNIKIEIRVKIKW
jgi:hypothetical protein